MSRDLLKHLAPSHVAIIVPSVKKAADYLKTFGCTIGSEDVFEAEGTKEIYVEYGQTNALLLVEPIKAGPYQRALEKRGPGLHHLAIDVLNLDAYLVSLAGSGWFIHPVSIRTIKQYQTAWLARPGFPGLIEVHEKDTLNDAPMFVSGLTLRMDSAPTTLLKAVGLNAIVKPGAKEELFFSRQCVTLSDLWSSK